MRLKKILGHSNLDVLRDYVNLLTQDLKYNEVELNPLEDFNFLIPISFKKGCYIKSKV